jgi:hypothetical protein
VLNVLQNMKSNMKLIMHDKYVRVWKYRVAYWKILSRLDRLRKTAKNFNQNSRLPSRDSIPENFRVYASQFYHRDIKMIIDANVLISVTHEINTICAVFSCYW